MGSTFVHDLGGARSIAGEFALQSEHRLRVDGREVLFLVGVASVDSACCGTSGCRYALVPGFVAAFHSGKTDAGVPTSEVELIRAEADRRAVRRAIEERFTLNQVVFW